MLEIIGKIFDVKGEKLYLKSYAMSCLMNEEYIQKSMFGLKLIL